MAAETEGQRAAKRAAARAGGRRTEEEGSGKLAKKAEEAKALKL